MMGHAMIIHLMVNIPFRFNENDHVVLPNDVDFADEISFSFSVFPEPVDDQLFIMQRSNAFALRFVRNSENELVLEYAKMVLYSIIGIPLIL